MIFKILPKRCACSTYPQYNFKLDPNSKQCNSLLKPLVGWTLSLFFCSPTAVLADWPEFRGPSQNGVVSAKAKLPVEWLASEQDTKDASLPQKNIKWFTPTEGLGWSSPILVAGRIYVTSAHNSAGQDDPKNLAGPQSLHLSCYSALDGHLVFDKKIFEQPADASGIHKKNSHASPTLIAHRDPASNTDRLFVHFGHQGTACATLDGELIWTDRSHSYNPVHGNGGSPIVVGNHLILTCDGSEDPYTLALDIQTGKEVWRTARDVATDRRFSFSTPQAIEVDGKVQVISPGSDIVQSLDPQTGKVNWLVRYSGFSLIVRPLFHQGLVVISTGYMTPKLLAIDPSGAGDVTDTHVRWSVPSAVPNTPSPVPVGDQIVMVSDGGVATGISSSDGKKIWQKRLGGNYSASPLAIGNRIYFQSESGEAVVMEFGEGADGDPPVEVARPSLPGRVFASYAVDGNDLIIRTENGLYRVGEAQ